MKSLNIKKIILLITVLLHMSMLRNKMVNKIHEEQNENGDKPK